MILNSRNNNYILNFPRNFLYPKINKRYAPIYKRLPYPYDSPVDFLNASVQQMTMPSISAENAQQVLYEDGVQWKGAYRLGKYMSKDFSVTFKSYEGYVNYWMMHDMFEEFLAYDNENEFLPNMSLSFLDQNGFELINIEYKQITMTGISELELNFSSNTADFQTFTCDFHYNYVTVNRRLD